jgi:hypothetical protein
LNGARQCGASACSTPFALDPVSRSVSSRSWKASQKRLSSAPTKGSPGRCPRVGARASCAAGDVPTPGACTTSQSWSDGASDDAPSRRTASSSIVERGGDDAKSGAHGPEFYRNPKTNNLFARAKSSWSCSRDGFLLPRAARRHVPAEKKADDATCATRSASASTAAARPRSRRARDSYRLRGPFGAARLVKASRASQRV